MCLTTLWDVYQLTPSSTSPAPLPGSCLRQYLSSTSCLLLLLFFFFFVVVVVFVVFVVFFFVFFSLFFVVVVVVVVVVFSLFLLFFVLILAVVTFFVVVVVVFVLFLSLHAFLNELCCTVTSVLLYRCCLFSSPFRRLFRTIVRVCIIR